MLLADDPTGTRIEAEPGLAAWCPTCHAPLLPKCGEIVCWHWAHHARPDCDRWAEDESPWHRDWKRCFPAEEVEVTIGPHRADILTGGTVIELQHGSLPVAEIRKRERFYASMVWVFDASGFAGNVDLRRMRDRGRYGERGRPVVADPRARTFRWKWPRKSHGACTAPLYWDLGDGAMFRVRRLYLDGKAGGWGRLGTKAEFLAHYRTRGAA